MKTRRKIYIASAVIALAFIVVFVWNGIRKRAEDADERVISQTRGDTTANLSDREVEEYLKKYYGDLYAPNYKYGIINRLLQQASCLFPNTGYHEKEWKITGQDGDNFTGEIWAGNNPEYRVEFLIKPDFSFEILSDTLSVDRNRLYESWPSLELLSGGRSYTYHGFWMEEYTGSYWDERLNMYCEAAIPLFSMQNGDDWNQINSSIWEGIEDWILYENDYENGMLSLDYEIETLDNHLFSILFNGQYTGQGTERDVAFGITVSMCSEELLSKTVFTADDADDTYYDFYVADDTLFSIKSEGNGWESVQNGAAGFIAYTIEKNERHIYTYQGKRAATCYYEVPDIYIEIDEAPRFASEEEENNCKKVISEQMRADMGRFLNEIAAEFEKEVLRQCEDDEPLQDSYGEYQCSVNTEIYYNNKEKIGVRYHYIVKCGAMEENDYALAVYDRRDGSLLEYQDWQSEVLDRWNKTIKGIKEEGAKLPEAYNKILSGGMAAKEEGKEYTQEEIWADDGIPLFYRMVLCGDFDGINRDDMMSIWEIEHCREIYQNKGIWQFFFVDVNGDGKEELLIRNEKGQDMVFYEGMERSEDEAWDFPWYYHECTMESENGSISGMLQDEGKDGYCRIYLKNGIRVELQRDKREEYTDICIYLSKEDADGITCRYEDCMIRVVYDYDKYKAAYDSQEGKVPVYCEGMKRINGEGIYYFLNEDMVFGKDVTEWLEENILQQMIPTDEWGIVPE